jgi:hypothetical protein
LLHINLFILRHPNAYDAPALNPAHFPHEKIPPTLPHITHATNIRRKIYPTHPPQTLFTKGTVKI